MGKVVLGQITQNLCDSETRRQSKAREALSGGELAQQAWGLPQNAWRTQESHRRECRTVGRGSVAWDLMGREEQGQEPLTACSGGEGHMGLLLTLQTPH